MNLRQSMSLLLGKQAGMVGFVTFFALGSVTYLGFPFPRRSARQPIAFNHARHIQNGLSCTDCHSGVETQAHATLPAVDVCMGCHQVALTSNLEEEKIRRVAASGGELTWIQLTQVPPHVFFSHRRHVAVARLTCAECHGKMETATAPPQRPARALTMNTCIGCHQKHEVNADCNDCHR